MSEPTFSDQPPPRPGYLVLALIAMWLVGVTSAQEGFGAIQLLRDPLTSNFNGNDVARNALLSALGQQIDIELPLAIGQLLLGGLLVFVATNIFLGGKPSLSFTLQVLGANLVLLIVSYTLREPTRAAYIDAVVSERSIDKEEVYQRFWLQSRFVFGFDLATLALCAVAFTRKATRNFLGFRSEPEEP
jgi:hypothetical protein